MKGKIGLVVGLGVGLFGTAMPFCSTMAWTTQRCRARRYVSLSAARLRAYHRA